MIDKTAKKKKNLTSEKNTNSKQANKTFLTKTSFNFCCHKNTYPYKRFMYLIKILFFLHFLIFFNPVFAIFTYHGFKHRKNICRLRDKNPNTYPSQRCEHMAMIPVIYLNTLLNMYVLRSFEYIKRTLR